MTLRSVRFAGLLADEVDCWPGPAVDVAGNADGSLIVDLVGQPAVAAVTQPEPKSTGLPDGDA